MVKKSSTATAAVTEVPENVDTVTAPAEGDRTADALVGSEVAGENTEPETGESDGQPEASEDGEGGLRVGPMHQAFADFLNTEHGANGITAEQVFLVTSKRKAFRATAAYREGVKGAQAAAKAAEEEAKAAAKAKREEERAAKEAEKEQRAKDRAEAKEKRDAERAAAKAAKEAEKAAAAEAKAKAEAEKPAAETPAQKGKARKTSEEALAEANEAEAAPAPTRKGKTKAAAF